jgi:16S rRNA processing protein RimM
VADNGRILLGRIVAAHGIRGDVLVHSFAGEPEAIGSYGPLVSADGKRTYKLRVVRVTPKGVIARIAGVTDRNGAEALARTDLYVGRDQLPAAEEGEYYHADLIGLTAKAPDGSEVGRVVAVHNFGAGDLLEIALAGARRTELLPFTDAFVPEVDLARRTVTIRLPESSDDDEGEAVPGDGNPSPQG